jgi:hypothetical protein
MRPWYGYAAAFAGSARCGGLVSSGALAVFWRFCSLSFVKANVILLFESNDKSTYNARNSAPLRRMDLEFSAVEYVQLDRVRCITKSATFRSCAGLQPRWPEVLFVCVLRPVLALGAWLALPGLREDLGGFARELSGLNCPNFLRVRLL